MANASAHPGLGLFILAALAGSADVIGYLGMDGLFMAHITGNLVVAAAHFVTGHEASVARLAAVPVFVAALAATRLAAEILRHRRVPLLPWLAIAQLGAWLLAMALVIAAGSYADPSSITVVAAGMAGVCAMAVQNALMQIIHPEAPATAVLTTNVTRFTLDLVELAIGRDGFAVSKARQRCGRTAVVIAGFMSGCAVGAIAEINFSLMSLVLPACLAALSVVVLPISLRSEPEAPAL